MIFESDKFGLLQAELKCLMLFDEERYLTVKGISQKMEIAKSRVTKIIDGLVHKELVERTDDPKDGRVTLISLTPKGKDKSRELALFLQNAHQKVLLQMRPDERKHVLSSLELLRSSMELVKADLK
jgi:DNA-binding MarR family transcriptional regulator